MYSFFGVAAATLLALTVVGAVFPAASTGSSSGSSMKDLVKRFFGDIWSKGDANAVNQVLSPDFQFILTFAQTKDIPSFSNMMKANRDAFQNLTYTPLDIVVDGDKASCHWKMTGKHVGTWRDIPATGKDVSIEGITFFESKNGKLTRAYVHNDVLGLMNQLNAAEINPRKTENEKLIRAYVHDILVRRDFTTFHQYATPDFHIDRSAVPAGITGEKGLNTQMDMLYAAFPDLDLHIADMISEGDKVLVRFEAPGTQTGEFAGIAPTGKTATWKGLVLYHIADGKITHAHADWDDYGLIMQLKDDN